MVAELRCEQFFFEVSEFSPVLSVKLLHLILRLGPNPLNLTGQNHCQIVRDLLLGTVDVFVRRLGHLLSDLALLILDFWLI